VLWAIFTVNNNFEKNPRGFEPSDFMPGGAARLTDDEDLRRFIEEVERGEVAKPSDEELEDFKRHLKETFRIQEKPRE